MGLAVGTVASWSSCFGIVPEAAAFVEDQGRGLVPGVRRTHLKPFLPGSCRPLVLCTKPASDGTSPEGSDIWNWAMTGRYFHLHLTERGKSPNYVELGFNLSLFHSIISHLSIKVDWSQISNICIGFFKKFKFVGWIILTTILIKQIFKKKLSLLRMSGTRKQKGWWTFPRTHRSAPKFEFLVARLPPSQKQGLSLSYILRFHFLSYFWDLVLTLCTDVGYKLYFL